MSAPDEIPGGRLWCPHFHYISERKLRQLFSKVAAVRSADRELFDFTHRRIEVFRGTSAEDAEKWGEELVYRLFSEDNIGNFVVVVEGEVGTGKSELCAYLAHRLKDGGRPILHINKDDDLMSILSERIPEFYQEHFDEALPGASEFQQLQGDIENNPRTVANNATSGALLNLGRKGHKVSHSEDDEEFIRDFVQDKLQLLIERGEYAREIKFVTEGDYKQLEELQVFPDDIPGEEAVQAWNDELWREIRERYETDSLGEVLEIVGKQFENTRPVIVFEDFAIASMEAERLRNYMERDNPNDNWDFIVAGTRDSTEILHTRTAEDRFEFFQTNRPRSRSVLFLDESNAIDFARPYLGYIKQGDGSVQYAQDSETGEYELRQAPENTLCAECGFCDENFRDLFPFNTAFLSRIYTGLDESQQSPREYIMMVFEVLEAWYEGHVIAPSSANSLRSLRNTISAADEVYEEAEEFADLGKWYGTIENDHIKVDRRFADAFGLVDDGDIDVVEVTQDEIIIPGSGVSQAETSTSTAERDKTSSSTDDTGQEEQTRIEQLIEEHNGLIDSWLENPGEYSETNRYIAQGIRDALKYLTDEFKLYTGTKLEYRLSSQKDPFVYREGDESPDPDQIILDRRDFRRSDLRRILRFGIRRVEEPRSADIQNLLEECGTQLMHYGLAWQNQLIESYLNSDDVLYKRHASYDFSDFILASYVHLVMLDSPWVEIDASEINSRYRDDQEFSIDGQLEASLKDTVPDDEYQHFETAMNAADHVEQMLGKMFGVSANNLDVPRIRARLQRNEPYTVLTMLGRQYIGNIEPRVRFGQDMFVREIANTMYDLRLQLVEIADHGYENEAIDLVSREFSGLEMELISELVANLKTYEGVNPDLQQELTKFVEYSQDDIDSARRAAETARRLRSGSNREKIHASLISKKLSATPVVTQFHNVPIDGAGTGQIEGASLGERFMEVSRHYVG